MNPVLFVLPGFGPVNAYGTLILLGGLLAMPLGYLDLRARRLAPDKTGLLLMDLYIVFVFGAALGGRLLHVLTAPGSYLESPARLVALDGTGFVFFGSMLAIFGGLVWLSRRYAEPLGALCDVVATYLPLGHGLGRVGCLMAGCCWGAPTDAPWSIAFDEAAVAFAAGEVPHAGAHTVPLHPTQAYEFIGLGVLFLGLAAWRWRAGPQTPWRQASRYAVGYGALRLVVEIFRGDASRGFVFEWSNTALASGLGLPPTQPLLLSVSQLMALGLLLAGVYGLRRTAARIS